MKTVADRAVLRDRWLAFFREQGVCYPEECARVTLAVGFACSIYWFGLGGPSPAASPCPGRSQCRCRPETIATPAGRA